MHNHQVDLGDGTKAALAVTPDKPWKPRDFRFRRDSGRFNV